MRRAGLSRAKLEAWATKLEFLQLLRLLAAMLRHPPPDRPDSYSSVVRLLINAVHAAVAVGEAAVELSVKALCAAMQPTGMYACGGGGGYSLEWARLQDDDELGGQSASVHMVTYTPRNSNAVVVSV